jgi:two-component system sensor histidine kinase MprB
MEVLGDVDALSLQDRERLLHDVVAQLDELTVLVTDLVDLARGDEPAAVTQDVRLDLLVEEAVERARRHASDKSFTADLQPTPRRGVPGRIDRAVSNLLDNAAKWSPAGGEIAVSVHDGEVTVRDRGPASTKRPPLHLRSLLPGADRPRTARVRPRASRSSRRSPPSHGGEVIAERADGGGTLMRLRIPAVHVNVPDEAAGACSPAV